MNKKTWSLAASVIVVAGGLIAVGKFVKENILPKPAAPLVIRIERNPDLIVKVLNTETGEPIENAIIYVEPRPDGGVYPDSWTTNSDGIARPNFVTNWTPTMLPQGPVYVFDFVATKKNCIPARLTTWRYPSPPMGGPQPMPPTPYSGPAEKDNSPPDDA